MDLEHGTATIAQQFQRRNGRLQACPLKTAHSARVIALDRTTIAALRAHRDRQRAEAAAYGDRYCDSGYVFTNLNGDPASPGRLTRARLRAHAFVTLEVAQGRLREAAAGPAATPRVLEVLGITGQGDLLVRAVAPNGQQLNEVIDSILACPGVRRSATSIVLTDQVPFLRGPLLEDEAKRARSAGREPRG